MRELPHSEPRLVSLAAAMAEIERRARALAVAGFYGNLPLVLKVQDGFVDAVHFTGVEEYKRFPRPTAA